MEFNKIRKYLLEGLNEDWLFVDELILVDIIGLENVKKLIEEGTAIYKVKSLFKHKDYLKVKIKEWLDRGGTIKISDWCEVLGCGTSSFYDILASIYKNDLILENKRNKFVINKR